MLPYIELTSIQLGPVTIYVWGIMVALGFLFGAYMAGRYAENRGLNKKVIYDLLFWAMLGGFLGGRIGYILFYNFDGFLADPLSMFYVWDGGLSVYGGFFLASALGVWYLRRQKVDIWRYSDAAIFGLPFGLWIGRIGCFLIHDHPGTATDFVLGVEYPDGVIRHDHGLYLSINGLLMGLFFLYLSRKKRPVGVYIASFAIWYGIARFFLDFTRVADVRYGGLTPAQYFSIGLAAFGVWLVFKFLNKKEYGRKK